MSVGISQVNFDAQVLEDEEEAALEKEDQEREQEIRELLNSELDDGLLDDDASFSSHDLRSSGYSRDTPFSEDFNEHQNIIRGQDTKTFIPSEGGAFERPPLITQRAFQFMNGTVQNQNSPTGVTNQAQDYDSGHHFEQNYNHQGYYDYSREYKEQESQFDDQVDGYKQNCGHDAGDSKYQLSSDDVDKGYSVHESYHPLQAMHGQLPYQQEAYDHYRQPLGNFKERHHGYDGPEFDEDYRGYFDEDLQHSSKMPHFRGGESINEQNRSYRRDNPENYQVQYNLQRQPHQDVVGKGPAYYDSETKEDSNGRIENGPQNTQLQILYKARGRKIEELTRKLESQEEEMTKEIRVLNHQNALMKDERDGLSTSLEQSQKMVQICNEELNKLKGQLAASYQQVSALQGSKEEVVSKLHVAETTIDSLNQQLVELSRSESLTRAREQHESVVNAMRKKHEEQVLALKQKLDEAVLSRDYRLEEANQLRDELVEKADMINSLTKSLDSSQKQCQELLKSGTMTEINQLRMALQESSTARNVAEGQCISLKHELTELKEQVKMYESASRLGVAVGSGIHDHSSFAHLTVRNLNKENWGTPKSHKIPLDETVSELRKELEQCLISNKAKREQVLSLEKELTTVKDQLKEQEKKAQRMESIAQEHEVKSQDLERKFQEMQNDKKDPDREHRQALEDLEATRRNLQESTSHLDAVLKEREELEQTCAELKQQMAQMVAEYDEDKRTSIEKCREACLQLHEDAKNLLRNQLNQEHERIVRELRKELEENGEELIRIKECYVQLSEESRGLEQRLKEEFKKEKEILLAENDAKLKSELRSSIEKQHTENLTKDREQWKKLETARIEDEVMKQKEELLKDFEDEKTRSIEEAVARARKEWQDQRLSDIDDQIAAARKEWLRKHNDELEKRLSNAIEEVRRIWEEEQTQKAKEEIDKVRAELEKAHKESRDHQINQAVELALSHAHADWLKNGDEMRQREIDQAIEVATTNAVAEAKEEWEREIKSQDNVLQAALAQERRRWQKEMELERSKAAEAAVAIAEVKWLEVEERKVSEAIEQALQVARGSWKEEKDKDIAAAVEIARHEWNSRKKDEVDLALETTSSQLVKQFEKQRKEAVEKAVGEARLQWEKRLVDQKRSETESLRKQIFREFEEQKKVEIMETLEEAKEVWAEEAEEQKREEVNEAVAYLEAEYAKSLDEFKHKELKEALEHARKQWTAEELSHREEIVQARLSAAREDWRREMAQSSQVEIDRALSTAREAWTENRKDELEKHANQVENSLREKLQSKHDEEKRQLVDDALGEAQAKFKAEKRKLEGELERRKADEMCAQWEEEKTRLAQEHQNQLERMRSEHNSKLKEQRSQIERDLSTRMNAELLKARSGWNKEQQLARVHLENEYEQKTRQALEKARVQWEEHQRQETNRQCEDAMKRERELWTNEKRENRSALEKVTRELTAVKKEYGSIIEKLKRELGEEKRKSQDRCQRQHSKTDTAQTAPQVDSGSDLSFSSVDNVPVTRGLEELRGHYLDTIARIRSDVLDHVNQTKASAAKKIRSEVLKERHSTAKKLRKYYLQCLKQLLEEDHVALEGNTSPSSNEDKLNRMAEALRTFSPERESSGQSSHQLDAVNSLNSPRSGILKVLQTSSESDIREIASPSTVRTAGRPRDSGPDGASDTGPITAKERELSPMTDQRLTTATAGGFDYGQQNQDHFIPEKDLGGLISEKTECISSRDLSVEIKAYNMSNPELKHSVVRSNTRNEHERVSVMLDDKERCDAAPFQPEIARRQKPLRLPSYKRSAPSPAFSVKSYESDQYNELPTVIHVSQKESTSSKVGYKGIAAQPTEDVPTLAPMSDMRSRLSLENRVTQPVTHSKRHNSSPGVPSKSHVDVKLKGGIKS